MAPISVRIHKHEHTLHCPGREAAQGDSKECRRWFGELLKDTDESKVGEQRVVFDKATRRMIIERGGRSR